MLERDDEDLAIDQLSLAGHAVDPTLNRCSHRRGCFSGAGARPSPRSQRQRAVAVLAVAGVCENTPMVTAPKRVTLSEPGIAGSYEIVERRSDGSLVLKPHRERLSEVMRDTEGVVFRDDEFASHLERVAATEDDLPPDHSA
jgi:hypothetical protein